MLQDPSRRAGCSPGSTPCGPSKVAKVVKPPSAPTFAPPSESSLPGVDPWRIVTSPGPTGSPPTRTWPVIVTRTIFVPCTESVDFLPKMTTWPVGIVTIDCASTAPAVFSVPVPGGERRPDRAPAVVAVGGGPEERAQSERERIDDAPRSGAARIGRGDIRRPEAGHEHVRAERRAGSGSSRRRRPGSSVRSPSRP